MGSVRYCRPRDRLHVPEPERVLAPPGRVRGRRPRHGADPRARPRAGALPRPEAGRPVAVLDARRDGRLHLAGAVAAGSGHGLNARSPRGAKVVRLTPKVSYAALCLHVTSAAL